MLVALLRMKDQRSMEENIKQRNTQSIGYKTVGKRSKTKSRYQNYNVDRQSPLTLTTRSRFLIL